MQQAIENWRRAGERAIEGSANLEAIAHLTRGLEKLEDLPASPQRDEKELEFRVASLGPLFAARFGSAEGERAASRALELSRRVGGDLRPFPGTVWTDYDLFGARENSHRTGDR